MGTDVELWLLAPSGDASEAFDAGQAEFERLERLLTRFDPASELSALNRAGSHEAGAELYEVVELALAARAATAGRFDPTVHDALVWAGYDRSFERVARDGPAGEPAGVSCLGGVELDPATRSIALHPGVRLDLGGIGKGYAVDRVATLLARAGPTLVDAGGDLRACGGAWPVGVETPEGTLTILLEDGALATSGRDRRRWRRGGQAKHHLIDPRTARPARSELVRVSVAAARAVDAEVAAKALFLAGTATAAAREADEAGIPSVLVTDDGRTIVCGGLA
jgi:thiamine biosynthesis lipoprotein